MSQQPENNGVRLTRPGAGQIVTVPVNAGNMRLVLDFAPASGGVAKNGRNLEFAFDNDGRIILKGYYDHFNGKTLPVMVMADGGEMDGEGFLASFGDELLTAAGPSVFALSGGVMREYSDDPGALVGGVNALGALGTDFWDGGTGGFWSASYAEPMALPLRAKGAATPESPPEIPHVPPSAVPEVPTPPVDPGGGGGDNDTEEAGAEDGDNGTGSGNIIDGGGAAGPEQPALPVDPGGGEDESGGDGDGDISDSGGSDAGDGGDTEAGDGGGSDADDNDADDNDADNSGGDGDGNDDTGNDNNERDGDDDGSGESGGGDTDTDDNGGDTGGGDDDDDGAGDDGGTGGSGEDGGDTGGDADDDSGDDVVTGGFLARAVLFLQGAWSAQDSGNALKFRLLAGEGDEWTPVDPAAVEFSLTDPSGWFDVANYSVAGGVIQLGLTQEGVREIQNAPWGEGGIPPRIDTMLAVTVNGETYRMHAVVQGGGDVDFDAARIYPEYGEPAYGEWHNGHSQSTARAVRYGTGGNDEFIYADGLVTHLNTRGGDDTVAVTGDIAGGITVAMGSGNNVLSVSGNISNGVTVNLGDGTNMLAVGGSVGGGSSITAGSGNDTVTIGGDLSGSSSVSLGDGNDTLRIAGSLSGDGHIDMGGGNDLLYLGGNAGEGSRNGIQMGSGDDTLVITDAFAPPQWGGTRVHGGDGVDTVNMNQYGNFSLSDITRESGGDAMFDGFEIIDLGAFNGGAGKANNITIDAGLGKLGLDTLLETSAVENLETLLENAPGKVRALRVTGDAGEDSVTVAGNWQQLGDGNSTVSYGNETYNAFQDGEDILLVQAKILTDSGG